MFRVLHLADLHLGYRPDLPAPVREEVYRERNRVLQAAVDLALDPRQGISLVLIAGDLFDNHRPEAPLVEETIRQLTRLETAGIQVITVPGNHDEITYNDAVYRREAGRWPGLLVTDPMPAKVATLKVKGDTCHLVAMAYTGGVTRVDGPLKAFPPAEGEGVNLAVFHGSLDWDGGERSLPLDGEALAAAGYDYIALGHIHRGGQRRLGRGLAVYAGMVAGKGFADPGTGSWTIVTLGDGPARVEQVPARVTPWRLVDLDVTAFQEPEELETAVRDALDPGALMQVRLTGSLAFDLDLEGLQARLGHPCPYLELVNETAGWTPEILESIAAEPTIRGLFVRRLQEKLAGSAGPGEAEVIRRAIFRGLLALKGGSR
ncbi:putative metallophosphoesterase YhaO [Moorella thermoacetica]|uniref:Putative metallophosphoesterase YhaO n=1 Tax=Neomoorella thermoacetica TaxID=1525 RepID=A0A1J5JFJ1_NEOTH|nr:DNA repair exonuclease [Moorella thermoacetica]OIQ08290.1 putative metallophosphoesterase YhaO [Moorella thermoacetica]